MGKQRIGDRTNDNKMAAPQCDSRQLAMRPCGCLCKEKNNENEINIYFGVRVLALAERAILFTFVGV